MEEAIRRAVKGGWANEEALVLTKDRSFETKMRWCVILIDPFFWQALDKSEWLQVWHRFIDHLAEGKDIDSFFEKLLK